MIESGAGLINAIMPGCPDGHLDLEGGEDPLRKDQIRAGIRPGFRNNNDGRGSN